MGRGSSQNAATATGTATVSRGARQASSSQEIGQRTLRQVLAQAHGLVWSMFETEEECEAHIMSIQAQSGKAVAGRGGRFIASMNDFLDAQTFLNGTDEEKILAQSMFDNALWHLGRISAEFEEPSEHQNDDGTTTKTKKFHEPFSGLVERYGAIRGPLQLDYLESKGLITKEMADELRPRAGELYKEAYATKAKKPIWSAITLLERTARAQEELLAVDIPKGTDAYKMLQTGLKESKTWIKKCQEYFVNDDKDHVNRHGNGKVSTIEAIASGFRVKEARRSNNVLALSGALDRHREAVGIDPEKANPVFTVGHSVWMEQMMNYQGMLVSAVGSVNALNTEGLGIFVGQEAAAEAMLAEFSDSFGDVITHELVHQTQPRPSGKPFADRGPKKAGQVYDRHRLLETQLMEGSTQARVNFLRRQANDSNYDGTHAYPVWTAVVDQLGQETGVDEKTFHEEFSTLPTYKRTEYLASKIFGKTDEATQRALFEPILSIIMRSDMDSQDLKQRAMVQREVHDLIASMR